MFRFCEANGEGTVRDPGARIILRGFGTALSSYVCLPGPESLGIIRETGEALVSKTGNARTPISKYRPRRLSKRFPKNYFRLYPLPRLGGLKGLGRRKTQGNQNDFLEDLCVVLPITQYDLLNTDGTVGETVTTSRKKSCVSFLTRNPELLIELFWDSSDDLDLTLTEPDGDIIAKGNPKSELGKLNNDNNVAGCGIVPVGKEAIFYRKGTPIETGTYQINVKHFNNCGNGPTKWTLRVILKGMNILTKSGSSDLDKRQVIETASFTL